MPGDRTRRPSLHQLLAAPLTALANADLELVGMARKGFERFLDADPDGALKATVLELPLGGLAPPDGPEVVRVPIPALVPGRKLELKHGRVTLAVELCRSASRRSSPTSRFEAMPTATADRRRRSRRGAFVQIEVEVNRTQDPETWSRIEQRLSGAIPESAAREPNHTMNQDEE